MLLGIVFISLIFVVYAIAYAPIVSTVSGISAFVTLLKLQKTLLPKPVTPFCI